VDESESERMLARITNSTGPPGADELIRERTSICRVSGEYSSQMMPDYIQTSIEANENVDRSGLVERVVKQQDGNVFHGGPSLDCLPHE
jgi:hypothetical protein